MTEVKSTVQLTTRELEVAGLLADGMTVKEIALQLVLSIKTVEAHKCNLMRKLDLHTTKAVTAWYKSGKPA